MANKNLISPQRRKGRGGNYKNLTGFTR